MGKAGLQGGHRWVLLVLLVFLVGCISRCLAVRGEGGAEIGPHVNILLSLIIYLGRCL